MVATISERSMVIAKILAKHFSLNEVRGYTKDCFVGDVKLEWIGDFVYDRLDECDSIVSSLAPKVVELVRKGDLSSSAYYRFSDAKSIIKRLESVLEFVDTDDSEIYLTLYGDIYKPVLETRDVFGLFVDENMQLSGMPLGLPAVELHTIPLLDGESRKEYYGGSHIACYDYPTVLYDKEGLTTASIDDIPFIVGDYSASKYLNWYTDHMNIKTCSDCGKFYALGNHEINWFQVRRLDVPKRCSSCRELRKVKKISEDYDSYWNGHKIYADACKKLHEYAQKAGSEVDLEYLPPVLNGLSHTGKDITAWAYGKRVLVSDPNRDGCGDRRRMNMIVDSVFANYIETEYPLSDKVYYKIDIKGDSVFIKRDLEKSPRKG